MTGQLAHTAAIGPAPGGPIEVALGALKPGPSPRLGGLDLRHVQELVELHGEWPPVLITSDYLIVDGLHRYRAARLLAYSSMACTVSDIPSSEALVESVRRNLNQGLPLTLRDRKHAARLIVESHPDWSDRRIAELCGLAHGTVAGLRGRAGRPNGPEGPMGMRQGRDGRIRPVDSASTRERILLALQADPGASLRKIAQAVGASPETVRAVKTQHQAAGFQPGVVQSLPARREPPPAWKGDMALHAAAQGDAFVSWLERTAMEDEWADWVEVVPLSRVYEIADEARKRGEAWLEFARALEVRAQ